MPPMSSTNPYEAPQSAVADYVAPDSAGTILGPLVGGLLFPVLMGGLMLGCDALRRGEPLTVAHLFAGFNQNAAQLILIGALYLAAYIGIMILVFIPILGFGGFALFTGTAT